jgi:hypothetical protein
MSSTERAHERNGLSGRIMAVRGGRIAHVSLIKELRLRYAAFF